MLVIVFKLHMVIYQHSGKNQALAPAKLRVEDLMKPLQSVNIISYFMSLKMSPNFP